MKNIEKDYEELLSLFNKEKGKYGNAHAHFIGLKELIKNKRHSKRKQDLADLEILLIAKKRTRAKQI